MKIFSLFSLIVLISFAHAGARQDAKVVMDADPQGAKFQAEWGYASAIRVGDTIYLSGDVAAVRKGETDLTLAYERAFKDIGEALKSAGASWDDVVDITTFHTDLTTQMPAIVAVKNRYIKAPFPAWTAIQVARLIPTNGITEIFRGDGGTGLARRIASLTEICRPIVVAWNAWSSRPGLDYTENSLQQFGISAAWNAWNQHD